MCQKSDHFCQESALAGGSGWDRKRLIPLASDIFSLKMEDYLCNKARPLGKAGRGRKRWVPPRWQACGWILDTLNALAYLHQGGAKQWVHRDLKPANLLLSCDHVVSAVNFWTLRMRLLVYTRGLGFDRVCELELEGTHMHQGFRV